MKNGIFIWILLGICVLLVMLALNYFSKNQCENGYLHMRELYGSWKCVPESSVKQP